MCTVTVSHQPLVVTMNRDEMKSRGPERPPRVHGNWAGPTDSDSGGTWFGANRELVLCLTNGYREGDTVVAAAGAPSRGGIIPLVFERGLDWLRRDFDPSPYASFYLVVARPGAVEVAGWFGRALEWERLSGRALVTSSPWSSVVEARRTWFADWDGPLLDFHRLRVPGREQDSPLMQRPEAGTRSITRADLGEGKLYYWPDPLGQVGSVVDLP
ncbi:MAG: NRDE family protein [Vulcanimicrobiota bacterium]